MITSVWWRVRWALLWFPLTRWAVMAIALWLGASPAQLRAEVAATLDAGWRGRR